MALRKRARTFAESGHDPATIQSMLEADGFTNEVAKLRYGKVRGELKEIADRARERQSSTASETAAQADEINRAAVMFNSAGCLET